MRREVATTMNCAEGIGHIKYYSRGEFVDIKCFGHIEDAGIVADQYINLNIRSRNVVLATVEHDLAAGDRRLFSIGGSIYLPEGHHIIDVDFENYASFANLHLYLTASPTKRGFDREEIKKATVDLIPDNPSRYP